MKTVPLLLCTCLTLWPGLPLLADIPAHTPEQVAISEESGPTAAGDLLDSEFARRLTPANLPPAFFLWGDDPRTQPPSGKFLQGARHWVIRQQSIQSRRIAAMSRGIDRTLSGETYTVRENDSYLRIGLANRYEKGGDMGLEPEVRFRLELPTLEEKFRLVIESDPDDLASLSEQQRKEILRDSERSESATTGALRYLSPLTEHWDLSADVGARLRAPLELFWRTRAHSEWAISPEWRMRVDQRFYYFNTSGWGSRFWLGFDRPIRQWHFLSSTEVQWVHKNRNFEMAQIARLERSFHNRHFWRLRLGVLGESRPNWQSTDFFGDILYRNRLYDEWLFAEVIPALSFPRDNSFKANPSITLRIEMFFSTKGDL